jgi:chemotaxis protein MotB
MHDNDPQAQRVPDQPPHRVIVRRRGGWLGWLLLVLLAAGSASFVWYTYLPLRKDRDALLKKLGTLDEQNQTVSRKLEASEAALVDLKASKEQLSGQLVQTRAEKEQLEAELKRLQTELTAKLEPEIQAGNVRVVRRGNELVVDLADQILFESGKSEVLETGKRVLGQVAPTLAQLNEFTIQVAGHTDSTRVVSPTTQERFPTNWELSTARATNVVRFLQETGNVPGERLAAIGFAEYRPTASNASADGRKKNRRIELVLMRK